MFNTAEEVVPIRYDEVEKASNAPSIILCEIMILWTIEKEFRWLVGQLILIIDGLDQVDLERLESYSCFTKV